MSDRSAATTVVAMDRRRIAGRTRRRRACAVLVAALAVLASAGCAELAAPDVPVVTQTPPSVRSTPPPPVIPAPEPTAEVAAPAEPPPELAPAPVADRVAAVEDQVVALANQARADAGLTALVRHPDLDAVALAWSSHLAGEGLDLAHNPDFSQQVPAGWTASGENVGWLDDHGQFTAEEVAARIHQSWMDSPGHRENLLNPAYTHIGVGVAHNPEYAYCLTQNFAAY